MRALAYLLNPKISPLRTIFTTAYIALCTFVTTPAHAELASLTIQVTNKGIDVAPLSKWHVYPQNSGEKPLFTRYAGISATLEEGSYDIQIVFRDGTVQAERWLRGLQVKGTVKKTIDLDIPLARFTLTITNNGKNLSHRARWHVYKAGDRSTNLATRLSGNTLTLENGVYDIGIFHREATQEFERWLVSERIAGSVEKTYDIAKNVGHTATITQPPAKTPDLEPAPPKQVHPPVTLVEAPKPPLPAKPKKSKGVASIEVATAVTIQNKPSLIEDKSAQKKPAKPQVRAFVAIREEPTPTPKKATKSETIEAKSITVPRIPQKSKHIELIIGAGSSMWDRMESRTKMEVIQDSTLAILDELPTDSPDIAVRTYGAGRAEESGCGESTLRHAFGAGDKNALRDSIASIYPSGGSPLSAALIAAKEDLPPKQKSSLVLLADSIDSCMGNPCRAARELKESGRVAEIFVLGVGISEEQRRYLDCIGELPKRRK